MTLRSLKIPGRFMKCQRCGRRVEHVTYDNSSRVLSDLKEWSCPCGCTTAAIATWRRNPKRTYVAVYLRGTNGTWKTLWENR